jgi:hypothetical protein
MSLSFEEIFRNADSRKRNVSLLLVTLSSFAWLYLVWEFRKWNARWGPINVLIIALVAAAVIGWWISRRT